MGETVFIFGEAERGEFCTPLLCHSLPHLLDTLGHPPENSMGISYAVQALLYERNLVYFRVKEEGFSTQDYMRGLKLLQSKEDLYPLSAILMPGIGDSEIIDAFTPLCLLHNCLLVLTEKDLYDYISSLRLIR